jgi:hypothetical protein
MSIFCLSRKVWSATGCLFYKDIHRYQHRERWNLFLKVNTTILYQRIGIGVHKPVARALQFVLTVATLMGKIILLDIYNGEATCRILPPLGS